MKKKKEDDVNYLIQQLSVADLRIIVELYLYWTSSVCPPLSLYFSSDMFVTHTFLYACLHPTTPTTLPPPR
jgi:hypothetical protein